MSAIQMSRFELMLFTHVDDDAGEALRNHAGQFNPVAFLHHRPASFDPLKEARRVSFGMGVVICVHAHSNQHQAHDRFGVPATMQRQGLEAAKDALASGQAKALLVLNERSTDVEALLKIARRQGVPVHEVTQRDLWRMAQPGSGSLPEVLTLVGREPSAEDLQSMLARGGTVLCLDGVAYAGNIGFSVRTAEVAGATGVVLAMTEAITGRMWKDIRHSSMQATRFIPVLQSNIEATVAAAQQAGFRIMVIEDVGNHDLQEVDLTGDVLMIVGAESDGVSQTALDAADVVVRLPMHGFVPSYNLQVAVACACVEAARQRS